MPKSEGDICPDVRGIADGASMNCAGCDYSALAEKPIEKGVTMLELTCYRRQSPNYLKPANALCCEFMRHHGDGDME